jgi:tetratricopeptide (TPR) repeat protein
MRCVPNPVACYALFILLGASQHAFAQTTNPPRKHVIADPAAETLNKLLDAAQEAAGKKDYAGAAKNYEEYLAKKPDDAIVHYDLGYAYAALNRPAEAKTEFERAIQLDPKMTAAYMNLGVTLLRSDPAAAVGPLQKAADLSPQDSRVRRLLGTALERSGKLAEAIEQYRAARKLDDSDFAVRLALGHALLNVGRASDSETEYRAALVARATDTELSQARRGLVEALVTEKKVLEGADELDLYLKSQPDDAKARVERASLLIDLGKYDDALAELDRAAVKAPEDLHGLKLRSDIYWNQKRYMDAVPVLQRAAALAPSDPDVSARLGEVYLQTKDYPNAVHWLASAYNMNPKASDVLAYLVDAEYGGNNYAETLRVLDELEKRQGLTASNWYFRGSCYDNLGQATQALDAYKKFLRMNKDENSDMYFLSTARVRVLTREVQNKHR